MLAGFHLFAGCEARPPADVTDPGHLIYLGFGNREVRCARCHGDEGTGGMFGPKLRGVVQRKGEAHVRNVMLHGKGSGEDRMPAFEEDLSPEQIDQLIRFLATWADSAAQDSAAAREALH